MIDNVTFLRAVFGDDYQFAHVCSFLDDPNDIPSDRRFICWGGDYFDRTTIHPGNQYFTISTFYADSSKKARRRKSLFRCTHVIVADDVREKLDPAVVNRLPPPSYKLETSPGSEQWGWILVTPCTDRAQVENLLDGLVAQGLAPDGKDPGMKGVTRYVRLPEGINTKASRVKANGGVAPVCRLLEWAPERRVSLEELAEPFGVNLYAERKDARVDGAADLPDHPLLDLTDLIHVKQILSEGRFDVTCPWVADHTNQIDNGTAVFTNGDGSIGFKCHHGSCQHRTAKDLLDLIEESHAGFRGKLSEYKAVRDFQKIMGQAPPPSPQLKEDLSNLSFLDPKVDLSTLTNLPAEQNHKDNSHIHQNQGVRVDGGNRPTPAKWPDALSDDATPGLLRDFILESTQNSEADPAAVLATFIVRFGIECGAEPFFMVGESRHYARENVVIVGDTSKGRKGTSAAPVFSTFEEVFNPCTVTPGPLSSGEGIIYAVRDPVEEWRTNRRTNEGSMVVTDPGVVDKRLVVTEEEFASSLQASKREGNTLSAILRTLYDKGEASPLTKTSRIKCTGAHVGVIGHITHFELNKCLSENDKLNGFGNRFLWICSQRTRLVPLPSPLSASIKKNMVEHLNKVILKARMGRRQYELSGAAKKLWCDVYPDLAEPRAGIAGAMVGRSEAHVIRLALIYCLFRGGDQIDVIDLKAALAFWKYADQSASFIFSGSVVPDRKKQKILEYIGDTEKTKTDIRRDAFSGHIEADELTKMLDGLVKNGVLVSEQKQTGGAPSTTYRKPPRAISVKSDESINPVRVNTLNADNKQEDKVSPILDLQPQDLCNGATPAGLKPFDEMCSKRRVPTVEGRGGHL